MLPPTLAGTVSNEFGNQGLHILGGDEVTHLDSSADVEQGVDIFSDGSDQGLTAELRDEPRDMGIQEQVSWRLLGHGQSIDSLSG
ncbi:MAG: hypothetical protein V9G13_13340 [Marmoricola sp.]